MATRQWLGDALAVANVQTITVADVWANADTITLTINGKDIAIIVGDDVTTTEVALLIAEAWNGTTLTDTTASSDTTGNLIPEYNEITAVAAVAVVTLTHDTKGVPFTLTEVVVTAGTGDITIATATAATGPNFWDNVDNWSGSTAPVSTDDVVFDQGSVAVKYALDQNAITLTSLTIEQGYTGTIGLPLLNTDAGSDSFYSEYRETAHKISATTITIGGGAGNGSGRIKLDTGTVNTTINVYNTGQRLETGVPPLLWNSGTATNNINVVKGDVGVCIFAGDIATITTLSPGFISSVIGDVTLRAGSGLTITNITGGGGTVTLESATTLVDMTDGVLTLLEGTHAALNIDGGTCFYRSNGTLTQGRVGPGGALNCSQDLRARTFTDLELLEQSTFLDPNKTVTFTNAVQLPRTGVEKLKSIDLGSHYTIQRGAIP
jgi:hypothetical protein